MTQQKAHQLVGHKEEVCSLSLLCGLICGVTSVKNVNDFHCPQSYR